MRIARVEKQRNEKLTDEDFSLVKDKLLGFKDKKGAIIPVLQFIQEEYGYLPVNILKLTSADLNIPLSEIYGVATFYAQFRLNPVGKHIVKMCHGTACHVQNVTAITESLLDHLGIKDGETTPDMLFTIETVACLGCCSLAPVMMIGEDTHGKLSPTDAVKIIKEIKRKEQN